MMALWTSSDAAAATNGHTTCTWQASGVSIDSRTLKSGDLFVAIVGPNFDGHNYIERAFASGAAAAVVAKEWVADQNINTKNKPYLIVVDTITGLEALARAARTRTTARITAITGSVGKTGTKYVLAKALECQGRTSSTKGNLNNYLGLPLSLARMPANSDFGVFELGMSQKGEIGHLSALTRPHLAVITNVEVAHLGSFSTEIEIANAKAEIFCDLDSTGVVLLNRDNRYFNHLSDIAKVNGIEQIFSFGEHADAEIRLLSYTLKPHSSEVRAILFDEAIEFSIGIPGRHWIQNGLAVLGASHLLGIDLIAATKALAKAQPQIGRGRIHKIGTPVGSFKLIDESYNANPASMRAALEVLGNILPHRRGRRIAVLGDMLELGPESQAFHQDLASHVIKSNIDCVFLTGEYMEALASVLPLSIICTYEKKCERLINALKTTASPDDVVLVKGSLGNNMGVIVDALLSLGTPSTKEKQQNQINLFKDIRG